MFLNASDQAVQIRKCLLGQFVLLVVVMYVGFTVTGTGSYLRGFGPATDLQYMGVVIDTWSKYVLLCLFLSLVQIITVLIEEIANPILGFSVYNPDKKVITEFYKVELQIYAQSLWLMGSLRSVFFTMATITRFDIAVIRIITGEVTSIFTERMLLNKKTFTSEIVPDLETGINEPLLRTVEEEI